MKSNMWLVIEDVICKEFEPRNYPLSYYQTIDLVFAKIHQDKENQRGFNQQYVLNFSRILEPKIPILTWS